MILTPKPSISPSEASLPSYTPLLHHNGSSEPYTYDDGKVDDELDQQKTAGDYVKSSKNGSISLRLISKGQDSVPTYGTSDPVEGSVVVLKSEGISSLDIKVEGTLELHEIAEGGVTVHKLCPEKVNLWRKGGGSCPTILPFKMSLPPSFHDGEKTYPLPPTYEEHLPGIPGFDAKVEYAVHVIVNNKTHLSPNLMKAALFGHSNSNVIAPIIFYPRSRPASPLPLPLRQSATNLGFTESPDWKCHSGRMVSKIEGNQDIVSKLYIPSCSVFCMAQPIPFHVTFSSSAHSLAAWLPYAPTASLLSNRKYTKMELLRQSTVDVRNKVTASVKTDIWKVDCIGQASFNHAGDGPDWVSFSGEIHILDTVELGGFRAGGLSVKDCLVLSMTPPDPVKSPFRELRQVIPVRLTTDNWAPDTGAYDFHGSEYSAPSTEEHLEAQPELTYGR